MARALELAARGSYHVDPNPRVGAVIARGDEVLAEGYHARYGEAHAEREALRALEGGAPDARRSELSLYVNLEPCAHHGNTPPCADAVLRSGIGRVVVAQRDPNPVVDGKGLNLLRKAGIEVVTGVLEGPARRLNAAFNKFMLTDRPLVVAKWAMSLDGKIAARGGDSKWISGEDSRRRVHELRGRCDAVVVGVETALKDDPRLTRRGVEGKSPARVVVDSRARIHDGLVLVRDAREHPTFLVTTELAPKPRLSKLRSQGLGVITVPTEGQRVDVALMLDEFARRGWRQILVEGGGQLLASFFAHDLVDQVHCFVAPKIIGGHEAPSPVAGLGVRLVCDALGTGLLEAEQVGPDLLIRSTIHEW